MEVSISQNTTSCAKSILSNIPILYVCDENLNFLECLQCIDNHIKSLLFAGVVTPGS